MESRGPRARRDGVAHTAARVPSCVAVDWPTLLSPKAPLRCSPPSLRRLTSTRCAGEVRPGEHQKTVYFSYPRSRLTSVLTPSVEDHTLLLHAIFILGEDGDRRYSHGDSWKETCYT